ncbi:tumor necrosis factor alpha-induced protein 2 [Discoglossus pictus]
MKVAEGLSDVIISIIQAVCRDELSHFISRYNNFVQNKVRETDSITGFYVTLRIIRNCHIVRSTYKDLVKTLEGTRAAMELIDQTESHALDLLVAALRSTIKEAFINYFTRDSSEYEKVLYALQESIKYAEIQNSEMVMKRTHCSVVVFYIQAFLKHSKKGSDSKTLAQGSKKLQEMFTLLVPAEVKLDNPIKFISQILDSQDSGTESLEVTTFAFVDEHPDLREKHLNAILDIKGNMSWTQREKLVWIVKERKGYSEEGKMRYFDEVEVEFRAGRCCPCCVVS